MWKEFAICMSSPRYHVLLIPLCHLKAAEDADGLEQLNLNEEQYPQLPETIGNLSLYHWKAILRQYMAAARHM